MSKSDALRLANLIEGSVSDLHREAAATELRRLHAELERCKQVCAATAEEWRTDAEEWKAQRDALLEALRLMMDCAGDIATAPDSMLEMALDDDDEETRRQANAFLVARAAIAEAEGA